MRNGSRLLLCVIALLIVGACSNPVIFQRTFIDYFDVKRTMQGTAGQPLIAVVSGQRCFTQYQAGHFVNLTHTFVLNDQVNPSAVSKEDYPNRVVLDIYDRFGIEPGQYFDYVLTLTQNGRQVESFGFRVDNTGGHNPKFRHRFEIKATADPGKGDTEGAFTPSSRPIGGTYVLSSSNGLGRPILAELSFPIANNQLVHTVCPADL